MSVEVGVDAPFISESTLGSIRDAARTIREGGVVAFPTETVYGMGANALDPRAVARVFELKGRPLFDPIIVHVPGLHAAKALTSSFPGKALRLAEQFWPGPLTLVLEKAPCIPDIVTAGLPRVGLRVPEHPIAIALLREAKVPIAAPSANPFGQVSPTTAQHVEKAFGRAIQVLDGGSCPCGLESTVVLVTDDDQAPMLLRPGGIPLEALQEVVGKVQPGGAEHAINPPAPGMLARHYATSIPLFLDPTDLPFQRIGWIGMGHPSVPSRYHAVESLSEQGDLGEAAANLFRALHRLDEQGLEAIWAQTVPDTGIGLAINDRLRRASQRTLSFQP